MMDHSHFLNILILLSLLCGCGQAPSEKQSALTSPEVSPAVPQAVLRLTRERLEQTRGLSRPPLVLPLHSEKVSSGSGSAETDDVLRLPTSDKPSTVGLRGNIAAEQYNALRVRMRVDSGDVCSFNWASDLVPRFDNRRSVLGYVIADNELHTYTLSLGSPKAETWAGQIRQVIFMPSNKPANVEIASMELIWRPPEGPTRITLNNQTHEALFGTQHPWELTVPPEATFEVHLGMSEASWREAHTDGVRFKATIDTESAQDVVIIDHTLEPVKKPDDRNWITRQVDLSSFAGERARINLSVDHLGNPNGDFAYWGNPVVFSRSRGNDIVPVILISCDTLRADHLSCYGYSRETTPHLDEFAKEAALFESTIAAEPWTPTAHASMLTGLYPKHHGVNSDANLAEEATTLAEVLSETHYLTAGFTGHGGWLLPWRGFSHGFDIYSTPHLFRNVFDTAQLVNAWLDRHPTQAVFLFFHNFDIHSKFPQDSKLPYFPVSRKYLHFAKAFNPPPSLKRQGQPTYLASAFLEAINNGRLTPTEEERAYLIALYDDSIRAVDSALHEFFERLKQLGLYDRALIIVTSDHGEAFGEHVLYLHDEVYEPCCRVPLIIKFPHGKFAGRRVTDLVQLIDIFPTVLDVLGLTATAEVDGRSLVGLLNGTVPPRRWAYVRRFEYRAVRTTEWKLLRDGLGQNHELYRLTDDSGEHHNLYPDAPPVLDSLSEELDRFHQVQTEGWHLVFECSDVHPGLAAIDITCRTGDQFETCVFAFGETSGESYDRYFKSDDGHTVLGMVRMSPPDREELILKTFSPESQVFVTVSSKVPFSVRMGEDSLQPGKQWKTVLDPAAAGAYPRPDSVEEELAREPRLTIWYEPPSTKRSPARELTEEQKQHLRSLGYLQ